MSVDVNIAGIGLDVNITGGLPAYTTEIMFLAPSAAGGLGIVWTTMPAAENEFNANANRRRVRNLAAYTQVRSSVIVGTVGVAGSKLGYQYSLNSGSTWTYLDGTADGVVGSTTPQTSLTSLGLIVSGWVTLTAAARADVWLRVVGSDGNAVASPTFLLIALECR